MAAAAARSFLRSTSVKSSATRLGSATKAARSSSSFASPISRSPLSHRIFRCPVEMSACAGSLMPFHTATASALMTSMLSLSQRNFSWLSEGI